jgi:hypothetical protein
MTTPSKVAVTVKFFQPNAISVEVIGNLTEGKPTPMTRLEAGHWSYKTSVVPGEYTVALIVDGKANPTIAPNIGIAEHYERGMRSRLVVEAPKPKLGGGGLHQKIQLR